MTDDDRYWIALNLLPAPLALVRGLHRATGSSEALAAADGADMARLLSVPTGRARGGRAESYPSRPWWPRVVAGLLGHASDRGPHLQSGRKLLDAAEREAARAAKLGIGIVTLSSARYPPLLSMTSAPPPVLYVRGESGVLDSLLAERRPGLHSARRGPPVPWWSGTEEHLPLDVTECRTCLAVVGSRRASDYGRSVARRLGRVIARAGGVVVSGLARGIDVQAHAGAVEAPGPTIAVLGEGLAREGFPLRHRELVRRILRQGLLISEFPIDTRPDRAHYPRRNRVISGLSAAVTVVEAARHSGALITARLALEEGREVFAVPGRITDPQAAGANGLLHAGAAGVLTREEDLVEDLPARWKSRLSVAGGTAAPGPWLPPDLPEEERALAVLLRADEPVAVDSLVKLAGRPAGEVLAALVGLEIRGIVRSAPGGRFLLVR